MLLYRGETFATVANDICHKYDGAQEEKKARIDMKRGAL